MANSVTVLGFNGRVGQAVTRAFIDAGWQVTGLGRGNRAGIKGMNYIEGSASNANDVRRASEDADIVVNALNLPYDKWGNGRAEALLAAVLEGLKGSGKTMLFPGNIYNYGAKQHALTPDTPQHPATEKGHIRKRMEEMLMAAATEDNLQVIVIRSADFYGPAYEGTMFDLAMLSRIKGRVVMYPGPREIGHSWAYLPDLGRAYVKVAEARNELPRFESFHFEGHYASGVEMIEMVQAALPRPAKIRNFPWSLLRIAGIFSPVMRAVVGMKYLWDEPHRLEDEKFRQLLGPGFDTPLEEAVFNTVQSYLPKEQLAARKALAS